MAIKKSCPKSWINCFGIAMGIIAAACLLTIFTYFVLLCAKNGDEYKHLPRKQYKNGIYVPGEFYGNGKQVTGSGNQTVLGCMKEKALTIPGGIMLALTVVSTGITGIYLYNYLKNSKSRRRKQLFRRISRVHLPEPMQPNIYKSLTNESTDTLNEDNQLAIRLSNLVGAGKVMSTDTVNSILETLGQKISKDEDVLRGIARETVDSAESSETSEAEVNVSDATIRFRNPATGRMDGHKLFARSRSGKTSFRKTVKSLLRSGNATSTTEEKHIESVNEETAISENGREIDLPGKEEIVVPGNEETVVNSIRVTTNYQVTLTQDDLASPTAEKPTGCFGIGSFRKKSGGKAAETATKSAIFNSISTTVAKPVKSVRKGHINVIADQSDDLCTVNSNDFTAFEFGGVIVNCDFGFDLKIADMDPNLEEGGEKKCETVFEKF